jgi:hypothetical protein
MPRKNRSEKQQKNGISIRDQACHTFALSGDQTGKRDINNLYSQVTTEIGFKYNFGEGMNDEERLEARKEAMMKIKSLGDPPVVPVPELYLCGGFKEGQVCPEHLWLEDHTHNVTYDTFINRPIIRKNEVGINGQPFQPGCEPEDFNANEIIRVKVKGYTRGQYHAMKQAVLASDYFTPAENDVSQDANEMPIANRPSQTHLDMISELERDPRFVQQKVRADTNQPIGRHGLFSSEASKDGEEKDPKSPSPAAK